MDVDQLPPIDFNVNSEEVKLEEIVNFLVTNKNICFKNQSREESDLTDVEKYDISKEIYQKSKSNFLTRFGKYLKQEHLDFFRIPLSDVEETQEINMILTNLSRFHSGSDHKLKTKNRRYEALNKLIKENSYFSENEMMKRNPLLYDQLVGQYLSENEKKERDMHIEKDTLVKILLEGIERDITEDILKKQLEEEEEQEDDDESSTHNSNLIEEYNEMSLDQSDEEIEENESFKSFKWGEIPSCSSSSTSSFPSSKWGEIPSAKPKKSTPKIKSRITKKKANLQKDSLHLITAEERRLLKEEFTSIMHQNFLNGKDDFDYATVDNNDEYDNIEILEHDEEEKYFDSEEPDQVTMEDENSKAVSESSEDELDIYMNALNQHPSVIQLSNELERM